MIKAVIFDIDGTLIDSVDLHAKAWQETFSHFGREIPFLDIRKQIGKGGDKLLPVFFNEQEIKDLKSRMEEFRSDLFKRKYLPEVRGFPAVRELFQQILEDDKRVALASSAKADELKAYKRIPHIEDLVEEETSSDDARHSKPDPDIFAAVLKKLKLPPDEAIIVGDTPYDAEAAGKAGLLVIGVLCGGWSREELLHAGCCEVYLDPADLLAHYQSSALSQPVNRDAHEQALIGERE